MRVPFQIKAAEDSRTPKSREQSGAQESASVWSAAVLCRFVSWRNLKRCEVIMGSAGQVAEDSKYDENRKSEPKPGRANP